MKIRYINVSRMTVRQQKDLLSKERKLLGVPVTDDGEQRDRNFYVIVLLVLICALVFGMVDVGIASVVVGCLILLSLVVL